MDGNVPYSFSTSLHNGDIFHYLSSMLVNSAHSQLPSTVSATMLLVELVAVKHGHHAVSYLHW